MRIPKRNFITHKLFDPCLDSKNCSQDLFLVNKSIQHLISFRLFLETNPHATRVAPSKQNSYVLIPSKLIQQSSRSVKALCAASGGEQQMLEGWNFQIPNSKLKGFSTKIKGPRQTKNLESKWAGYPPPWIVDYEAKAYQFLSYQKHRSQPTQPTLQMAWLQW